MRHLKCITFLLIGILFASSFLPQATAQSDNLKLFDRILLKIYKMTYTDTSNIFPWAVGLRITTPNSWVSEPSIINIEYLNKTEITIGMIDAKTGTWTKNEKETGPQASLFPAKDWTFELITEGLPEGAIIGRFDPQQIISGEGGELRTTNLVITTNIPKNTSLPPIIKLRVNITKWETGANLYLPPKGSRKLYATLSWFLFASGIRGNNPFGRELSGKRSATGHNGVDILVRTTRFHLAEIMPPKIVEIKPDQVISIPLKIQNLGSHVDSFNFKIDTSTGEQLLVSPPPSITLNPGEIGYTSLSIASPPSFQDQGTLHSIYVEAYSVYDPTKTFKNTVAVITRGVYVSEMNGIYSGFFGIIIILGIAFIFYRRKKKSEKICKKPEKPWEIPEEKEYLEELKKKDKKEYDKVLKMMEEEYESALLWYKSYLKVMTQKEKQEKQKTIPKERKLAFATDIFKKSKVKKVEAKKLIISEKKKIPVKTKGISEKPDRIDTEVAAAERKKQEVILRIKREQEKQKKNFRTSI